MAWARYFTRSPLRHADAAASSQSLSTLITNLDAREQVRLKLTIVRFTSLLLLLAAVLPMTARQRAVRPQVPQAVFHYRGDAGRSGNYAAAGARTLHGRKWQAVIASAGFSAPVYANGSLYLPDGGGHIVAYDANTGAVRWTSPHIGDIVSAPAITADLVYAGVDGNGVVALSVSTGAQLNKFATDSEVFASPVIETGILYAGCESGSLYAFDLATQHQLWRFNAGAPLHGHPAVANGTVIVGAGNSLVAIDSTGREKWRLAATHGGWSPSFAAAGGMIYASDGNVLRGVSLFTGSEIWSYPGAGWTAPAVANGLVITGSTDNKVTALDAASGAFVWQTTLKNATEVIVADGVVYGGTANFNAIPSETAAEKLYALDAVTGQSLWSFDVVGEVRSGAAVGGGKVFVHTLGRNVYAVE